MYLNESEGGGCRLFGDCTDGKGGSGCKSKLLLSDGNFADGWVDPLLLVTSRREKTDALRNLLAGRSAFLACGGPSANDLPLERLQERGMWTMAGWVERHGNHVLAGRWHLKLLKKRR